MPQMEANQPSQRTHENYGAYEGTWASTQQQEEIPYQRPPQASEFDDNFVEALSQRIAQHLNWNTTGKVYEQPKKKDKLPAEYRTGIAIVSIIALIPLGIVLGQAGFGGLLALGIITLAIFLINAVVNNIF